LAAGAAPYVNVGSAAGSEIPPFQSAPMVMARQTNGLAVASLVCSCVGIIPFFFGLPCILGIVFGFVARSQIRRTGVKQEGDGLALAGIIVGFSLIGIFIVVVILLVAFGNSQTCFSTFNNYNCSVN
jgi:hypothetical protein